jgi:hypothetical protein
MKRGLFAANRKPIPGAKTVKVVVVVRLHYYLSGEELLGAVPNRRASLRGQTT